ncbi:MAG TPA: transcription termination factor NusA [Opitutaceae bacterium]|jgi:transcription termination/antitermination protein NusA|nr:transcription termination/antitermination protein NusA [Opitutaceae bacterium]MBP8961409.1 transcription termination/antitermination protein NusA [Opitutaceae bacterium]HOD45853.1 transcription termination factor NusA [Opitutaceae bacterium]HOF09285.1 transcription termination factor NusA [Opitutaceae bacterium]HOR24666.1 transcription termination factor NusA [Opitutaceae bacterium]
MSSEILTVLEYMEKEKGIQRADMIATIVNALKTAAQKGISSGQELKIEINPKNGTLKAWAVLKVVDSVSDPKTEIHLEKAQALKPGAVLGELVEREIDPSSLGRIAAQTARQAVMQRIRQFEKDRIFDDFKDQVGNIVTGTVRRRERGDIYIDLGKAEAVMPAKEQVPGEEYQPGDRIRCLLLSIDATPRGPEVILSRGSPKFVRRLFELEVTEVSDGTVKIEAFAREPGYRTKIAVTSTDPKVDPVGACVGARGARVKTIVRELGGEKIDIIKYFADPREMVIEALKPAVPREILLDEPTHRILLRVATEDLAIAIGRKGQNARLTSRLIGWRIDIEEFHAAGSDPRGSAMSLLQERFGFEPTIAARLVDMGINSPAAFEGVDADDLESAGFTPEEARSIVDRASAH